jgi:transcription elongation factor GreB
MSRQPTPRPPRSACITAAGKLRLEQEYQRLWSVERPRVAREVGEAAALGDRSENAEYIYGKRRLREIDSRLEFLSRRLDELRVIAPADQGDGVVRFGAWVELARASGESVEYQIVGPDEFDVDAGRISMDSPLGQALLGRSCGDEVIVRRPKGDAVFEITAVTYRIEA